MMLGRCSNDMSTLGSRSIGCAEQREIIALRAAAGEDPLLRGTAQKPAILSRAPFIILLADRPNWCTLDALPYSFNSISYITAATSG